MEMQNDYMNLRVGAGNFYWTWLYPGARNRGKAAGRQAPVARRPRFCQTHPGIERRRL